ncbi:hypothetical protein [Actinomadura litoris]|uniref:hypothetical protein n=1 Tax=Actinomadura litoris TaxID=2678616 RepID=UPI001FA78A0A|nr:hypothetical protein [Actinomadura litoris]
MPETTRPQDVPDLIEMAAAAICNNDGGATWDKVRKATAERYRRLATRVLNAVAPEIERQVRERVAAAIEAECSGGTEHWNVAMDHAARIARGEQ